MGEPNSELLRIAVTDIPDARFDGVGNLGLKELEIDVTQLGTTSRTASSSSVS
jgi:hypothetical protein